MINNKKLCVEISENLGNQMFMYAHAYALSKKLNRELYVDNESAYLRKKSIGSYRLYYFNISSRIIDNKFKFLTFFQYLKKKYISILDCFKKNKFFKQNKKLFDFSDEQLSSQYKLQRKINEDYLKEQAKDNEEHFKKLIDF